MIDEADAAAVRRAGDAGELAGAVAVQVTPQAASAIFSRFSQSGVVQMSLAWAEKVQRRPVRIAA